VAKLAMNWPLLALAAYFSYRVIRKARDEAPVPADDDPVAEPDA
jgi:hypothetical protein